MAFSMFLRNSKSVAPIFRQQLSRLATQSCIVSRSSLPAASVTSQKSFVTPTVIYNPACSLRSSTVVQKAPTEMPHNERSHDHAKLWVIEKAVTAAMLFVIPAALIYPNKILDAVMATLICAHSFWGLEAIAVDYVRASIFGPIIPKIAIGLVYAIIIATLGGCFYVIGHDIGIANIIRSYWSVKSEQKA